MKSLDGQDVQFVKLFFTMPAEEEIAYTLALRLAEVVGERVQGLRPTTTLYELLEWGVAAKADPMDFVVVFEPELRMGFARFLDDAAHVTFREMVVHVAMIDLK